MGSQKSPGKLTGADTESFRQSLRVLRAQYGLDYPAAIAAGLTVNLPGYFSMNSMNEQVNFPGGERTISLQERAECPVLIILRFGEFFNFL